MEDRKNEATPQRPEGDRLIEAPLVLMNLTQSIEQLRNEPTWQTSDRNAITLFKSESMRIVLMGLHKDALLKTHTANGTISVQVLEGKMQFKANNQDSVLDRGQMLTLQKQIPHSVLAIEETFFLLTMAMS